MTMILTSAECKGHQDGFVRAEADGIKLQREWIAAIDGRTRHVHRLLDGQLADVDKPFESELGDIMYPGDPEADPANVYNCRCTIAAKVIGFGYNQKNISNKSINELVNEANQLTKNNDDDIINSREEAKKTLIEKVGFTSIDSSVDLINETLLIENTNKLVQLENRFGAINSSKLYLTSKNSKGTCAYVATHRTRPTEGCLSLCNSHYAKLPSEMIDIERKNINKKTFMPCAENQLSVFSATHEYGHILQNILIQDEFVARGWKYSSASAFVDRSKKTAEAKYRWYIDCEKTVEKRCYKEIISIAKNNEKNFSLSDNISLYGRESYSEFFAEVFANAMCGKPNSLGKAMQQWLKMRGY